MDVVGGSFSCRSSTLLVEDRRYFRALLFNRSWVGLMLSTVGVIGITEKEEGEGSTHRLIYRLFPVQYGSTEVGVLIIGRYRATISPKYVCAWYLLLQIQLFPIFFITIYP